ncbi:MAG: nucleotide exchange factor GrpE [Acidobacteria bacterium]|nr:MAG: nucleotide exchange factor GrpE [Acidobacteriota bacterium]
MSRTNTNSEIESLDVGHELPRREEGTADNRREHRDEKSVSEQSPSTESELSTLKKERDALLDRLARDFALEDALKSLLPTLDSFDWALQSPARDLQEFRSGVELIRKQLHDALGKLGITSIPAKGEQFDPSLHEAVETTNTTSSKDNQVAEELQRGYRLKDRLLRPAMVIVARNPKE